MISHPLKLEKIQADADQLAVAPQILPKLQTMVSNCNTNPDDIRDMIRLDPAVSSMILKTANSAYFNPGYHIDSIDDAIMQLGFNDVYKIVTMLAFTDLLAGPLPTYGLSAGQFWRRSVACALAMECLARKYGEDPGAAYTIGLLHGVGMIFLEREIERAPGVSFRASLPEDIAIAREEMEVFGLNHAKLGAMIMKQWGFSEEVSMPVMCQFEPSEAGRYERMTCLISFAKRMLGTIINDSESSVALPGPDPLLIALLHLSKKEYQRVVEQLRESYEKARGLAEEEGALDTNRRKDARKIMASNLGYGGRRIRT